MKKQDFKNFKHENKCLFSLLIIVLSIFIFALAVSTTVGIFNKIKEGKYIGQEFEAKNTITVSDKGEIYSKPDLVLTNFSVINEAKTVDEAMRENTEKMNAIIDSVKNQGVEEKDLKTISFNIYPRYEYYEDEETRIPPYPQGRRVLVGYEIRQTLQVKIRDMNKIGQIIEGATDAGANQVGNLEFTIDKQDELKKQARAMAIEKAKAKADEIALQLGVDLVRITNFSEGVTLPRYYGLEKTLGIAEAGAGAPQIEIGENKIEVIVSITYEIK